MCEYLLWPVLVLFIFSVYCNISQCRYIVCLETRIDEITQLAHSLVDTASRDEQC